MNRKILGATITMVLALFATLFGWMVIGSRISRQIWASPEGSLQRDLWSWAIAANALFWVAVFGASFVHFIATADKHGRP